MHTTEPGPLHPQCINQALIIVSPMRVMIIQIYYRAERGGGIDYSYLQHKKAENSVLFIMPYLFYKWFW